MTTLKLQWILLAASVAMFFSLSSATAVPLLSDDFNDNSLDPAKWTTNLNIPQGGASVTEQNQRIELVSRGHLNTALEYDPVTLGGLRITGDWTFVSGEGGPGGPPEFIQVLTRSDGLPNPANCCGETTNGVEFYMQTNDGNLVLRTRNAATIGVTQLTNPSIGAVNANQVFNFEVIDDGLGGLSFTMTEIGGAGRTATATGTVDSDLFNSNVVTFHNREAGRISYLDNVSIETLTVIPEPSSIVLAALGLLGLVCVVLRRRRA